MATQKEEARRNGQEVDDEFNKNCSASMDCKEDAGVFGEQRSLESQRWRIEGTGCVVRRVLSVGERSENSKKLFQIFRQGVNEAPIASMARWEEHLRIMVALERKCLALRQEVELLKRDKKC